MEKREEIVSRLTAVLLQEKEIRKELDTLDYRLKLEQANVYAGKYFRERNESNPEYIRCIFVHSIDKETCEPKAIEVSYWTAIYDDHYHIGNSSNFNPKKWNEEDLYIEITKEEFYLCYAKALEIINNITK